MNINRLSSVKRIAGLRHSFETEEPTLLDIDNLSQNKNLPQFNLRWKMFELDSIAGFGKV